jgi:hypothetical protein
MKTFGGMSVRTEIEARLALQRAEVRAATIEECITFLGGSGLLEAAELLRIAAFEPMSAAAVAPRPASTAKPPPPAIILPAPKMTREQANASGYTGDLCTSCQGMQVKRNGSCLVCETCGQTTGCS